MHSTRLGKISPVLIAVLVILLLAGAAAGWFYWSRDTVPSDLKVLVDGKEVDPAKFMKDAKITLKDGPQIDLKNPHGPLAEVVGAYFALPEGPKRLKYLDDMIDQQEKTRKEMGMTTNADGMSQFKAAAPATQPGEAGPTTRSTIVMRGGGAAAADSMAPELRAQLAEYIAAINKRRAERGLPPQQGFMMIRKREN